MRAAPVLCANSQKSAGKTVFKIANNRRELEAAFHLVHDAYVRSELIEPNEFGMRVTPYHLLPTTEVFVAVHQGDVICTMSLIGDARLGLPMESIYEEDVARLRYAGFRTAEVSCLADRRQDLQRSFPIVSKLMSFVAQCAKRRGWDQLLAAVHPRHAKFYQRFLAFNQIGEEKSYPSVRDNPAVAVALGFDNLETNHPDVHRRLFGRSFPEDSFQYRSMPATTREHFRAIVNATGTTAVARENFETECLESRLAHA